MPLFDAHMPAEVVDNVRASATPAHRVMLTGASRALRNSDPCLPSASAFRVRKLPSQACPSGTNHDKGGSCCKVVKAEMSQALAALTKRTSKLDANEIDLLRWILHGNPRHDKHLTKLICKSICNGDWRALKVLHDHGFYTTQMANHQDMSACIGSDDMCLAIHVAAREQHVGLVKLLVSLKADLSRTNDFRETALHLAADQPRSGRSEAIIRALLDANPSMANAKDDAGQPPQLDGILHRA